VDHYAEERFAERLRKVVSEDGEPGVLGALFVGGDGEQLLVLCAGLAVEVLEFMVCAWDGVAGGKECDEDF
jgi:hypothetical protein